MSNVQFEIDENGAGSFFIMDDEGQLGEMTFNSSAGEITIYHTGVEKRGEGKGYAKELLNAMVNYARENQLKIIPVCPYVSAQFRRNPDAFADVWLVKK